MMELDFVSVFTQLQALTLGGVSLAVLVVILTEVVKEFSGITGKAVRAVALGIGFVLSAVAYGLAEGLIPPAAEPYIEWAFASVVGGLGGMGLWHLGKRFLSTNGNDTDAPPVNLALAEPGELSVTATGPGFEIVDDG